MAPPLLLLIPLQTLATVGDARRDKKWHVLTQTVSERRGSLAQYSW